MKSGSVEKCLPDRANAAMPYGNSNTGEADFPVKTSVGAFQKTRLHGLIRKYELEEPVRSKTEIPSKDRYPVRLGLQVTLFPQLPRQPNINE